MGLLFFKSPHIAYGRIYNTPFTVPPPPTKLTIATVNVCRFISFVAIPLEIYGRYGNVCEANVSVRPAQELGGVRMAMSNIPLLCTDQFHILIRKGSTHTRYLRYPLNGHRDLERNTARRGSLKLWKDWANCFDSFSGKSTRKE